MKERLKELIVQIENMYRKIDENVSVEESDIQSLIRRIRELKKILRHNN
jgi:hypothetical protein